MISQLNIIYIVWVLLFVFTCFICFFLVNRHLINYTSPNVQRNVIRIILLCPLNSGLGILSLFFPKINVFTNIVRNCYLAHTAHCYLLMMNNSIGEKNMIDYFESHGPMKGCCKTTKPNRRFFNTLKFGVIQYFIVKILCSIAIIVFIFMKEEHHVITNLGSFAPYEYLISIISLLFCVLSISIYLCVCKEKLFQFWPMIKYRIVVYTIAMEPIVILPLVFVFIKGPFILGFKDSLNQAFFFINSMIVFSMFLVSILYLFIYSFRIFKDLQSNEPLVGDKWKDSLGLFNYLDVLNPKDIFYDFVSLFKSNNNKFKELVEQEKNPEEINGQENESDKLTSIEIA
ncbi:hypothetical protein RB653_001186 [Dictyostelium firmibasis]|uniref:Transmembrane protein n=1 Tax=Dictyostelium firmibasis TaxID=79012 RepID=A0AAN7U3L1_9MYCE